MTPLDLFFYIVAGGVGLMVCFVLLALILGWARKSAE